MAKTYNGRFNAPEEPGSGNFWLVAGVLLIVFGNVPGLVLGILSLSKYGKHKKERRLYERFFECCAVIGMRDRVPVKELAKAADQSASDMRRDLQAMIGKGYFGDSAYLDVSGGCRMLAKANSTNSEGNWKDTVFELIRAIRGDFGVKESIREEKDEAPEPEKESEPKNETVRDVKRTYMDELERTLNELYQLNREIEDEGVSKRIDRIGQLTGGIFRAVIENPDRESDVRKFMNYYLPTTLKLLKSYDLMESQSYQGENILESRKKIEHVLDMLIEAYEKQLDRLFRNDALDIATDIDVLEAMMAGDGLSSKGRLKL